MSDFNAKVSKGSGIQGGVVGEFGLGERNQRGDMLIAFCHANDLYTTNTPIRQNIPNRFWTWESPGGVVRLLETKSTLFSSVGMGEAA